MSSFRKRFFRLSTVKIHLGCGSCRKMKLSDMYNPEPEPQSRTYRRHKNYYSRPISSSSGEKDDSVTTPSATPTTAPTTPFSPRPEFHSCQFSEKRASYVETSGGAGERERGFGSLGGESVAVEKDSDDPYMDFRHSMLQMILENHLYSKQDLKQLLHCFLQLNSPDYHGIILHAFAEIWNGVYSDQLHFRRRSRHPF